MKYHSNEKIVEAAKVIGKSRQNVVEVVTILNNEDAKKEFLQNAGPASFARTSFPASANPKFVYDTDLLTRTAGQLDAIVSAGKTILDNCEPENLGEEYILNSLILSRVIDARETANIAQSILDCDDEATAGYASKKFEVPSPKQSVEAYNAANALSSKSSSDGSLLSDMQREELKEIELTAPALKLLFTRVMIYLGIEPWPVEITRNCTAIDVRDIGKSGVPTVYIPESRKVNGLKAVELICHEICCHLRGSDNGQSFFKTMFANTPLSPIIASMAKADDETLYEGVAKISDVAVSGEKSAPSPLATVAIDLARRGMSFVDVAEVIYEYKIRSGTKSDTALSNAWGITYRVFRGATNTVTNTGCYAFPKDAAYFLGYKKARELEGQPMYSNYASMTIEEIENLANYFPNFAAMPREYERKSLIEYVATIVLEQATT